MAGYGLVRGGVEKGRHPWKRVLAAGVLALHGCGGQGGGKDGADGADGLSSLVSVTDESPGINCRYGGLKVESGRDGDGNGSLDGGEVAQTRFLCDGAGPRGWGVAEVLETGNDTAGDPQVGVDDSGNAIAVWEQSDGTRDNIWANRYVAGSGWGEPERIEANDNAASEVQVAVNGGGHAVAVWKQSDGTQPSIWANHYDPDSGWGAAEKVESRDAGWAANPQVALEDSGAAMAVWAQDDGNRENIRANRYEPGIGWGSDHLIETHDGTPAEKPQVAMDGSGNAVAVWSQMQGGTYSIRANRYDAGSGWEGAAAIEAIASDDATGPQVAMDERGHATAVWKVDDGTGIYTWANRYEPGSGWGTAGAIETATGNSSGQQVAMDASGNAVAVWAKFPGGKKHAYASRYMAGSGWGAPYLLETHNAGGVENPRVAVDGAGNALVVWQQGDGVRDNIWANRFLVGAGWGSAQVIETDDSGEAEAPQVALDPEGNGIAVWQHNDGTRFNIVGNRFTE
ncbi:DUF7151 family protein [Thiohalorhabdus sp. Cl-TMA]|uniref:DUF7151 domain-containing protein n=1 Tax=Thiohalorhabdus methylotrophus TaxID=3242694 RepID=A0ABV4U001_9GAMM